MTGEYTKSGRATQTQTEPSSPGGIKGSTAGLDGPVLRRMYVGGYRTGD